MAQTMNETTRKDNTHSLSVLVVDDCPKFRSLYSIILSRFDIDYTLAEHGRQGLEQYIRSCDQGKRFDVVLSDITMPYMDGKEMALKIRDYERKQGIEGSALYAISSNSLTKEDCKQYGFDDFIEKMLFYKGVNQIMNQHLS